MQVSFYRIDKSRFEQNLENKQIIDEIVHQNTYNTKYKKVKLKKYKKKVHLYYHLDSSQPSWRDFFSTAVEDECDSGINEDMYNIGHSFLAFISEGDLLLAFCGGQGNNVIKDYIVSDFGVSLFCRMFTKEQAGIRAAEARSFIGSELASHRLFRREQNLMFEDDFGKIYSSIQTEIKAQMILKHFPLEEKDLRKNTGCLAKTSFQLKKSIDLKKALEFSSAFSTILKKEENFPLNRVKKLDSRRDSGLIEELEKRLISFLYDCFVSGEGGDQVELCPKNKILEHLKCDSFKFFRKNSPTPVCEFEDAVIGSLDEIFLEYKNKNFLSIENLDEFKSGLVTSKYKFSSEDDMISEGYLLSLVNTELTYDGVNYLRFDGSWYRVTSDFVDDLNRKLNEQLDVVLDASVLRKQWERGANNKLTNEEDYISKYFNTSNVFPLHTIKTDNIEPCDILVFKNDSIYLVHIKKGFDASVRELCQQALVSYVAVAKAVYEKDDFLKRYYLSIRKKSESTNPGGTYNQKLILSCQNLVGHFNQREFLKEFSLKKKMITPCIAFVDISGSEKKIKDGSAQFDSNIAKFSTRNLISEMGKLHEGLSDSRIKVIQIPRVN